MEKLFLNNPYIKEFRADIEKIEEKDGHALVVLNRTAFFPEGGGQPSDTGTIDGCSVSYVYEEGSWIYHVCDRTPPHIHSVECSINWERRFDHMQQHCGQHILSAAFVNILNAATVGFHLGEEYVTIDISADSLCNEDAVRVEKMSNDIVFKNLPVIFHYPDRDELSKFPLRKAPTVTENIRIVEIEGYDYSPCCGTHPLHTGDVGLIKIRRWEKCRDSIRVEFVCGRRAILDYEWKNRYINEIAEALSSKDTEVLGNTLKTIDELRRASKEIKQIKEKLLQYEADELYAKAKILNGVHLIKQLFTERDFKDMTYLAGLISKHSSVITLLGLKGDDARIVFSRSSDLDIKINEIFKEVLPLINGKGGGSPQIAQGGGSGVYNIESALDSAEIILKNRYLNTGRM